MSQVFLHIVDGRTLWVPTHKAAAHESGTVVVLSNVTPQELVRSFYLFDVPIQVVDDSRFATSANAKSIADVTKAVANFRERCARDESFMMSSRYNPGASRPPQPPTVQQQQQQQPQPYINNSAGAYLQPPMGYPQPPQVFPTPPMGMPNLQRPPYMMANPYTPPIYHHHHHHQQLYPQQGGAYNMQAGGRPGGFMPPPQHHHQHHARMGYPGAQQPPPQQARFQDIVFNKPQPVDLPVEVPKDVTELYNQPNGRLYLATLPSARITVWLRSHTMQPSNYQRYVHCKGGISLMMKAAASDIVDSKPVELFDRQLCTHFLAHNYCSRKGCLHVHHSESQLRQMIAVKHVLLQDTSKREREQMAEDIVAKDRACQSRPKEDFETRYAIVMAMPPTFVTGTPANLLRGTAAADDPETQAVPNVLATTSRPTNSSRNRNDDEGHHDSPSSGAQAAPPPPPQVRPGRYTGPIGVASDSDTDSSDTETSSSDDSSSSSSSSDDESSSDDGEKSDGDGDKKSEDEEVAKQRAEIKAQAKENKKKLRKLVDDMKADRIDIEKTQKKEFHGIHKAADEARHRIRKQEKKDRKKRDKRQRSRSSSREQRRRSTSRHRD